MGKQVQIRARALARIPAYALLLALLGNFLGNCETASAHQKLPCGEVLRSERAQGPELALRASLLERIKAEIKTAIDVQPKDRKWQIALRATGVPIRVVFYPAAASIKTFRHGMNHVREGKSAREAWKIPLQVFREDYLLLLGFLWLILSEDGEIIQAYDFDAASSDFDKNDGDELLVVVEMLEPDELGYGWAASFLDTKYARFKRKRYIQVASYRDLVEKLKAIVAKDGKIGRLDLIGFGSKGAIYVGWDVGSATVGEYPMAALFARDAQIRLSTCVSGRGAEGDQLMDALGRSALGQGGTVYASTVSYYPLDEVVFRLGLGGFSRGAARYFTQGPAAAFEKLSRRFDFSPVGLSHRGGHEGLPLDEPKVKVKRYPADAWAPPQ